MKTADLTGALLDYWTSRAEGVPAGQLEIRPVQRPDPRTPDTICVRGVWVTPIGQPRHLVAAERIDYSTNWALAGPLQEKHRLNVVERVEGWRAYDTYSANGPTPPIAICRAVVRAAFGDEVEDLP